MRKTFKTVGAAAILLFGGAVFTPAQAATYVDNLITNLPKQSLSEQEIKDLLHMREEEKLARDVYLTLYDYWRLPIFRNIARSENWHMHMVGLLLKKYGIPDPVEEMGDRVGVFKDPHIQKLYDELVAKGKKSLVDALKVGATIEDLDIYDLERALSETDNKDIRLVYLNLMKGSRNHMRAFVRTLRRFGADYKPQYISQEEFEKIISTPIERGFVTETKPWRVETTTPKVPTSKVKSQVSNTIRGKVVAVEQKEGPRGRLTWWVAKVETAEGVKEVYLIPTLRAKTPPVSTGDEVEIVYFSPLMWKKLGSDAVVACSVKNLTTGGEQKLRRICPRFK